MDYYDYLYEEILCDAYARYLTENCKHDHEDDCECMNLKEFEEKFLDDREEAKYLHCEY